MAIGIVWEERGAIGVFSGHVTTRDMQYFIETVASSPRFDGIQYRIADTTAVQAFDIDEEQFACVSAIDWAGSRLNQRLVTAAVAVKDETREYLRLFGSMGLSPHPAMIFETLADAKSWIAEQLRLKRPAGVR